MKLEQERRREQLRMSGKRQAMGTPDTAGTLLAERIRSDEESGSGMEGEVMGEPPADEI